MSAPGDADDARGRDGDRLVLPADDGPAIALVGQGPGDLPGLAGRQGQLEGLLLPVGPRVAGRFGRGGSGLDVAAGRGDLRVGEMEDRGRLGQMVVLIGAEIDPQAVGTEPHQPVGRAKLRQRVGQEQGYEQGRQHRERAPEKPVGPPMLHEERSSDEDGTPDQAADEAPHRRLAAAQAGHRVHVRW